MLTSNVRFVLHLSIEFQNVRIPITNSLQDYCKSMEVYSTTETIVFKDKDNNDLPRTLTYVSDLQRFFSDVVKARDIEEPKFVLGCDYGKEKLIVTASLFDEKDLFADLQGGIKPSSAQAAFILAMTDQGKCSTSDFGLLLSSSI